MSERDDEPTRADAATGDTPPEEAASDYRVQLESFEGPLDLLLYLIRKDELSIYDIPIARVTDQYLEYVRLMEELDIGVAGEFLLMAATLIHIKSKLLLPRDPDAPGDLDELEDPRRELVERLLEHQRYKGAAEMLHSRAEMERAVFTRPDLEEEKINAEVSASVFDLLTAFRDVVLRAQAVVEIEIARDEVTLGQKIGELRVLVETTERFNVRELFERSRSKRELVITFLAILELVKTRVIRIVQGDTFGDILAQRRDTTPEEAEASAAADAAGDISESDYR